MATFEEIFDARNHPKAVKQVTVACWKLAAVIQAEAASVENHRARLKWADTIQSGGGSGLVDRMLDAAAMNPTIQSEGSGSWVDASVDYVVSQAVDVQAAALP